MKTFSKIVLRAALIAGGLLTLGVGAASAGEWRIDAKRCPDLSENRAYDEDRRDGDTIYCPARAWYYVRYADDSRLDLPPPHPNMVIVYRDRDGYPRDIYYRDARGEMVSLDVSLG